MADLHSKQVRSYNMSRIKGKNTKPELIVRKFLFSKGFRYRLHDKRFPGKPDLVFPKYKTVVFVHGCFWHGHENCKYYSQPKSNREYWLKKIIGNIERDKKHLKTIEKMGWRSIVIWECRLKKGTTENTLHSLAKQLRGTPQN